MRFAGLLCLLLLAGCRTPEDGTRPIDGPPVEEPSPEKPAPAADPTERFLDHPTVVKAAVIRAIFPADLEPELQVSGLSVGWKEEAGRKVWKGSGEARVKVRKLVLAGPSVTVTLVASQPEREIVVQATGNVAFGHTAPGGTAWEGKDFLMIRNDRWLER